MDDDTSELSQAERMIRRVSPEGRALAHREAAARARSRRTLWVAALAAVLVIVGMTMAGAPVAAIIAAAISALIVMLLVALQTRPKAVSPEILVGRTDLRVLPRQAAAWLADQRPALPAPAVQLADALSRRLGEFQPQLARLQADEPAAQAVRKLLAVELPGLVEGYRGVPASLRDQPRADGRTADAHLLDGLRLIDGEVARMTEQLARGALDEVATQHRYLELKYRSEGEP